MEINSCIESHIAACDFATSIASAYTRLSTKTIKISGHIRSPSGLESLLEHKKRLRKLWQETRDPPCKTAVNWVTKIIRRMGWRRKLERWEIKIENCEVIPQAVWFIVKFLTNRGVPKARTAIHGPLDSVFYPNENAYLIEN
jgi:ribosomal protein L20A (L18A)